MRSSAVVVFIEDIIFWIITTFLIFIFLLARTNGEIRGYVLLAVFVGFVISRFTISRITFKIMSSVFKLFKVVYFKCCCVFAMLLRKIDGCLIKFVKKVAKIIKNIVKTVKKLLKTDRQMMYTK